MVLFGKLTLKHLSLRLFQVKWKRYLVIHRTNGSQAPLFGQIIFMKRIVNLPFGFVPNKPVRRSLINLNSAFTKVMVRSFG